MNCERLTREDSRARTRQRLLESAQKLIAKRGLSAASVEDIAGDAGYSRGAFYSNFNTKDELLLELLCRDQQHFPSCASPVYGDRLPGPRAPAA